MEKYIPYEKLSKKKRRELDARRRETWTISPITRRPENPKAYKRKKTQDWNDDSFSVSSLLYGLFGSFSPSTAFAVLHCRADRKPALEAGLSFCRTPVPLFRHRYTEYCSHHG